MDGCTFRSDVNPTFQTESQSVEFRNTAHVVIRQKSYIFDFSRLSSGTRYEMKTYYICCIFDVYFHIKAPVRIGVIFKHLRKLMDTLLQKKLENPRMDLEGKSNIKDVFCCFRSR